ncbi:MAG: tRNA (N(6)-L-threonylcarbamoyladenosine(37)-C(2))-methylthiotransferase MtaB [Ignavibacteriales bacterium UTCHB1]|nr:tRNA (N(6)-L-threonylcarbamoyladenosine(37)-C(2))-methylthiotransferase MtaB [Ignavibacteria bacterium]OQY77439.1 MAG: tRNA (N(6)-L-threonylcarbamoyladenosine(37)-C(2))-methylthiotransferase MtaB [Ignavibacteriales bacterium UTCHB1]
MNKSVSLHTLGCKLNYSETSTISNQFRSRGFEVKDYGEVTDIFVLNTCSVTSNADRECRQIIRSVLRNNPETYIIVIGCYAQLQPEEIAQIEGVDIVLGAAEKFHLFEYVESFEKRDLSCIFRDSHEKIKNFDAAYSADSDSRTRAFLKIQDGCDYKCTFCTIPLARGGSRSLAFDGVIENAKKIIDAGYNEIILTGVNTGDYKYVSGKNINKFIDVLYELEKLNIQRIRISSIEPNLLNNEIIDLVASSEKFCNHFHIPLQSGDNNILKLMKRRYNREFYESLIYRLNEKIYEVGIGVDVITGFPGETEENFINTLEFLESLPISYLHVFTYSERKNTEAVSFSGRVNINIRRERTRRLRELSDEKTGKFYNKYRGTEQKVLFESATAEGTISGYTTNYIRVVCNSSEVQENTIIKVQLSDPIGTQPVPCRVKSFEPFLV